MLEKYTTILLEDVKQLADVLSQQKFPELSQFEPVADFEELLEFVNIHPTPIKFSQDRMWRFESVAARIIEILAISAHESLTDEEWISLSTILLEHAEYLYTYPDSKIDREKLVTGGVLALVGCVCSILPQSEQWRLAGYGRIASTLITVNPSPDDLHLIHPIDVGLSLANLQNLPILDSTIESYNTILNRDFRHDNCIKFPISDADVFSYLNLEIPELTSVHKSVKDNDILGSKLAYTAYRKEYVAVVGKSTSLELTDEFSSVKAYLNCLLQLSIYPTPPIYATTELAIAAILFPELRFREQLISLAYRRYKWIIDEFFFQDGFHKNRTFKSQIESITDFGRFLTFYNSMDDPPHFDCFEELHELIEKLIDACLYLYRPDSSFPPLDGQVDNDTTNATDLCNIPYLFQPKREDITYILSSGKDGKPLSTLSYALPDSGFYVMRDLWNSDAQYLFFDCGQPDNAKLDFQLFAHGRQLLTNYSDKLEHTADSTNETRWISSSDFDYVEGWKKTEDFEQKRSVFYLRGGYYILHDFALGNDEYRYEQTFSLTSNPDEKVETQKSSGVDRFWTESSGYSNIFMGVVNTGKIEHELHRNRLLFQSKEKCPISLNVILFPMGQDYRGLPSISQINVNSPIDVLASGFTIDFDNTVDLFLISDDGFTEMSATVNGKRIEFEGEYLFLRGNHFIMLNGRYLRIENEVIVELDEPIEYHLNISSM